MINYKVLNEAEYITKKNFIFNKYLEFGNDSPYIFVNHFSNLNYSDYAIKVTNLLKYNILEEEIRFLKKYYGKKKFRNKYRLSKIIKKNLFPELIKSLVINKRLEFLLEYIENTFHKRRSTTVHFVYDVQLCLTSFHCLNIFKNKY